MIEKKLIGPIRLLRNIVPESATSLDPTHISEITKTDIVVFRAVQEPTINFIPMSDDSRKKMLRGKRGLPCEKYYDIGETIGEGGFGFVTYGRCQESQIHV